MASATHTGRQREALHESFLRHRHFRWLKICTAGSLIAILTYALVDITPRHNGGSWLGYTLGTLGAAQIVWLAALGIRKRRMTREHFSLKAWTSAHVYIGLSLIIIATLHTGFQFGWNVHTLAYTLMMIVIVSGMFGVYFYATLPVALSSNREEMTQPQMIDALRSIDRQLHDAAQPLEHRHAALVRQSLDQNPFGGGLVQRLSGHYPNCATRAALAAIRRETAYQPNLGTNPIEKVDALLVRKEAILARVRRHLKLKALLEVWLYVHVPFTFALIAALSAHIISVFFYW